MAQLVCENLTLGYGGRVLVKGLSFEVNSGDYLCIVGENGAGKSTLMRTILSLQSPMKGRILLGDGLKANQIGYLPQQTLVQRDFPASVREIVLSGCQAHMGLRPLYKKEERMQAEYQMQRLGISDLGKRCYRELSGGQQQRVLLARALCATEKILLLDEPVSGLDPKATADMYQIIEQLNRVDGITIIMISHDVRMAVRFASHILQIGSDCFFGTKQEYVRAEKGQRYLAAEQADAAEEESAAAGIPGEMTDGSGELAEGIQEDGNRQADVSSTENTQEAPLFPEGPPRQVQQAAGRKEQEE